MTIDTEVAEATWLRYDYDVAAVQAAIRATSLPSRLADRLEIGV
jgi:hypothetical protein